MLKHQDTARPMSKTAATLKNLERSGRYYIRVPDQSWVFQCAGFCDNYRKESLARRGQGGYLRWKFAGRCCISVWMWRTILFTNVCISQKSRICDYERSIKHIGLTKLVQISRPPINAFEIELLNVLLKWALLEKLKKKEAKSREFSEKTREISILESTFKKYVYCCGFIAFLSFKISPQFAILGTGITRST